jgi:hypothetical protein
MLRDQHQSTIRGFKGLLVIGLGSLVFGLLCGCGRSAAFLQETTLGGFIVNRAGGRVQSQFRIPATATNVSLGFFVEGLKLDSVEGFQDANRVFQALASGKLRVRLGLQQKGTTNDFYRAEFSLGDGRSAANCGASRLSASHQALFLFNGIQPLDNRADFDLEGDASVSYYYRQGEFPLKKGKLVPGEDYVVELTVLKSIGVTNEFKLWLGCICGPSGSRGP